MSFREQIAALLHQYPIDDAFIEELRKFVSDFCQKHVPVQVHNTHRAERRLELGACEAIALFWQQKFGDKSWFPVTVHPGWPQATCVIKTKPIPTARISFQVGPETDGERGGVPIEPIEIPVLLKPPNIISKAFQAFNKRDLKAEREKHLPPVGKPEMVLSKPVERKAVTPTPAPKSPAPVKPGSGKLRAK